MSVLLFSGLVGPVNRFQGEKQSSGDIFQRLQGELEALYTWSIEGQEGFSFPGNRRWARSARWAWGLPSQTVSLPLAVMLFGAGTLWVSWPVWGWGSTSLAPPTPMCNSMHQGQSTSGHKLASVWWTSWCVVVTAVALLRDRTVQCSRSGWRAAWAWWLCQRGGGDKDMHPALQDYQDALCAFSFLLFSAYQIIYLLLTMPVFPLLLHDLSWNQVLVTDQPGLVWSLSTVCLSAFNTGSWPRWV